MVGCCDGGSCGFFICLFGVFVVVIWLFAF